MEKDLLVALSSQHIDTPVIVITEQGMENDVIQAFRLGAYDYLRTPIREAEVVASVERALKQVSDRKERQMLARKLQQSNQELEHPRSRPDHLKFDWKSRNINN
jgi:DNA-binding NtrC family response regulator